MANVDQSSAECVVFTFKEGLLSTVAHDLKLKAQRFQGRVSAEGAELRLSFEVDAASLVVQAVVREGKEDPQGLSEKDKAKIAKTIQEEVLHSQRHPKIRFEGQAQPEGESSLAISGTLALHGVQRALSLKAQLREGHWEVLFPLHQPDFGIKPFSAMFGALKIQPEVKVRIRLPSSTLAGEIRHG